jgi:hypothetical protein
MTLLPTPSSTVARGGVEFIGTSITSNGDPCVGYFAGRQEGSG